MEPSSSTPSTPSPAMTLRALYSRCATGAGIIFPPDLSVAVAAGSSTPISSASSSSSRRSPNNAAAAAAIGLQRLLQRPMSSKAAATTTPSKVDRSGELPPVSKLSSSASSYCPYSVQSASRLCARPLSASANVATASAAQQPVSSNPEPMIQLPRHRHATERVKESPSPLSPDTNEATTPFLTSQPNSSLPPAPAAVAVASGAAVPHAGSSTSRFSLSLESGSQVVSFEGSTRAAGGVVFVVDNIEPNRSSAPMQVPRPPAAHTTVPMLAQRAPPRQNVTAWIPMSPDNHHASGGTHVANPDKLHKVNIDDYLNEFVTPSTASLQDLLVNSMETLASASKMTEATDSTATDAAGDHMSEIAIVLPDEHQASALQLSSSVALLTTERMWLLFRVYIRIRLFAQHWKTHHKKSSTAAEVRAESVLDLLEAQDSTNWLHVYKVEWQERKRHINFDVCGPLSLSSQHPSTSSRPSSGRHEAAFLYLSCSHVYLASQRSTNSVSVRYPDVMQVLATKTGVEIICKPEALGDASETSSEEEQPEDDSPSSLSLKRSSGPADSLTAPTMRMTRSGYFQATSHPPSPLQSHSRSRSTSPVASSTAEQSVKGSKLVIRTKDATAVMINLLDLQARFLRSLSMSLTDRLLLRAQTKVLHIVHFNDVYHLPPFKPANARGIVGGAGRFHTVLAKLRETTNPLVLFSGDFMGPSLMSVITKGKQMVDAFNFLGVHYGVFGNHEFDYTLRTLKEVIHGYTQGKHIYTGSQTTWVMSNMVESDGTPLGGAKPYAVCVWSNVRVGLLGLCENWLPQCANLHPSEAVYLDMFECGERLAQYLKEIEGCDVVFALTHNRNNMDREVALRCPTIDYIFGGHDHKFKSEPKYRFLKSGQEFEFLSTVEVVLAPGKKPKFKLDCIPITYDIKESEYMKGLINRYDVKMAEKLGRTIGKSDVELDSTEETVRFKEGHLTNFILDVIQNGMETELAFLGAAAISGKEVKPAGNVTLGDIFGWFPNETKVMTMKLKGSTIRKTLDVMVRELPAEAPSFPHPSEQLTFTINMLRKPPICEDIFINHEPLDLDREYLCAVEDFVGVGKAKYKHVAAEGEVVVGEDDAVQVVTLVRDFFLKKKISAVDAKDAATIKNVTKVVSSATHIGVDMDMAKSQRFVRSLICELLHCNRSSIFLVDDATNEIHFMPDGKDITIRMPKDKGLAGYCATSCEHLNILDAYEDSRFNRDIDLATGYRTKTMLCCPVLLDGVNCSAVVQAINKDGDVPFDELDEITLRVLGEQVSFQLRYQVIFQRAKAELEFQMSWVLDIFRSLTSDVTLDLVTCLKAITTHAVGCFRCDAVRVYRFDPKTNHVCYLEEGLDDESIVVSSEVHPQSFVAELLTRVEGRVLKDASRTIVVKPNDGTCFRNAYGLPLVTYTGACIGVVVLGDKPRGFGHDDELVGNHFSKLAAVSLENSVRLSKILAASSETILPTVPFVPLGRITIKGGWATVRKMFRIAKLERKAAIARGEDPPPYELFFGRSDDALVISVTAPRVDHDHSHSGMDGNEKSHRQLATKLWDIRGQALQAASAPHGERRRSPSTVSLMLGGTSLEAVLQNKLAIAQDRLRARQSGSTSSSQHSNSHRGSSLVTSAVYESLQTPGVPHMTESVATWD